VTKKCVDVKSSGKKSSSFFTIFIYALSSITLRKYKSLNLLEIMKVINRSNATYHTVNMKDNKVPDWPSNDRFRFVDKRSHINVDYSSLGRVKHMHTNIILFIIQAEWCLVLTFVLFSFLLSWFFFALLYFLVSIEHGDFTLNESEQSLFDNQTINSTRQYFKIEREKCVQDVHNFLSSLLFSIETQHTIGYGSRYITTECMGGILVLTLQSSLGYLLQVIVTQIVFSKLSRPTEKSQFVVFSNNALIAPRNNQLTLTFRIGNLSVSQLIFASVRLLMIRQRRTIEGEIIPHQIYDMELTHLRNGQLFFPRPTVVEHIIDSRSPLYGIQRSTLSKEHFEIIAIIEGSFDYTGFPCHFRTSYLPDELLWGHQFSSCNSTLRGFDYEEFNYTKLINAEPFWNYAEEEENNDSTTPNSPHTSPYLSRKEFINTNCKKNLQGQNLIDDNDRVNNKRYGRLPTIESIPNIHFRNITTMESTDNDEEELTENIEKQYVESQN
jgi:potassium inwardly-rectifying channel subfamily J